MIPAGELTTVPLPVPVFPIRSVYRPAVVVAAVNVAVTEVAPLTVTAHVPVPPHPPPLQPANVEPDAGVAVRVTVVPAGTDWLQSEPQVIPAGLLTTVPVPVPAFVTARV